MRIKSPSISAKWFFIAVINRCYYSFAFCLEVVIEGDKTAGKQYDENMFHAFMITEG